MPGLPKIALERLKRIGVSSRDDRRPPVGHRPSTIDNQYSPHPDANLVAAFLEETLTEGERAELLDHLAGCVECRELVALALPAEINFVEPTRSPLRKGWNVWPALRWAALAAVIGLVAIVVLSNSQRRTRQATVLVDKRSTLAAYSSQPAHEPAAESSAQSGPNPTVANAAIRSHEPPRVVASLKKQAAPARTHMRSARSVGAEQYREVTVMAAARPPAPAAPPLRAQPESMTVTAAPSPGLAGRATVPVTPSPSPPVPSAEPKGLPADAAAAPARAKSATGNAHSLRVGVPTMAFRSAAQSVVAQPAAHWTISPEGNPQRSEDGGKTWQDVRIDDKVTFRAIEAVGRDVWAGGSEGALYHSSDSGASWTRVNLSSDGRSTMEAIISIISSPVNPHHLSVKAASGEQWNSDDGGQHWKAVTHDE